MTKLQKQYIFTGFGFDVILHNVEIKESHGETYPDINLNEVKILTAKELVKSREKLTGKKIKFLRTFLKLSYINLSEIVDVPASTLRSWEEKGNEVTGLTDAEERQLRVTVIDSILDLEKKYFAKQIVMTEKFELPKKVKPVDLGLVRDYSFCK
jgi:DNA-binding transcriptional regulator YiaG